MRCSIVLLLRVHTEHKYISSALFHLFVCLSFCTPIDFHENIQTHFYLKVKEVGISNLISAGVK